MQFSDNGTTWTPLEPFALTRAYTLPGTYGVKKVYARFIDSAGKVSAVVSDTITYAASTVPVTAADVTIKSGCCVHDLDQCSGRHHEPGSRVHHDAGQYERCRLFGHSGGP